jgi:hypothetical protein
MSFFYVEWFGQRNPSGLLIDVLKYFRFWFLLANIFNFLCILSILIIHTDWFRIFSVNEQIYSIFRKYTEKIPVENLLYFAFSQICTDSFCIVSIYEQIYSSHTQHTYRFLPRTQQMCRNNFEFSELNYFLQL